MNARLLTTIATALFAGACSGCLPLRYTYCPGASGVVADAQSKTPVTNAIVTVVASAQGRAYAARSAVSGADGAFRIRPARTWGLFSIPSDPPFCQSQITVERVGYSKLTRDAGQHTGNRRYLTTVSNLFLEPVSQ